MGVVIKGDLFREGFVTVPAVVINNKNLTIGAKMVYTLIYSKSSPDEVVQKLNISEDEFYEHVEELESSGFISISSSGCVINTQLNKKGIAE